MLQVERNMLEYLSRFYSLWQLPWYRSIGAETKQWVQHTLPLSSAEPTTQALRSLLVMQRSTLHCTRLYYGWYGSDGHECSNLHLT